MENFVRWCQNNQLQLNATKTKEMVVVDFIDNIGACFYEGEIVCRMLGT